VLAGLPKPAPPVGADRLTTKSLFPSIEVFRIGTVMVLLVASPLAQDSVPLAAT
jgi:hypothetical protein